MTTTEQQINSVCNEIKSLLLLKNKAYGNSALEPVRIFSKNDSIDGLLVRIDDKLSRIKNTGITSASEDTLMDLIGYLVLLKMQINKSKPVYDFHDKTVDMLGLVKIKTSSDYELDKIRYAESNTTGY